MIHSRVMGYLHSVEVNTDRGVARGGRSWGQRPSVRPSRGQGRVFFWLHCKSSASSKPQHLRPHGLCFPHGTPLTQEGLSPPPFRPWQEKGARGAPGCTGGDATPPPSLTP